MGIPKQLLKCSPSKLINRYFVFRELIVFFISASSTGGKCGFIERSVPEVL
jgi:hypothetical protein